MNSSGEGRMCLLPVELDLSGAISPRILVEKGQESEFWTILRAVLNPISQGFKQISGEEISLTATPAKSLATESTLCSIWLLRLQGSGIMLGIKLTCFTEILFSI